MSIRSWWAAVTNQKSDPSELDYKE